MNSAPEDFSQLRRLLVIKRYEQPPPGYFREFPRRVIMRLEATRSIESKTWVERLMLAFELKPMLVGSFGVAAFGLLLFGFAAVQQFEEPTAVMGAVDGTSRSLFPVGHHEKMAISEFPNGDVLQSSITPAISTQPPSALFEGFRLNVQPVSFSR